MKLLAWLAPAIYSRISARSESWRERREQAAKSSRLPRDQARLKECGKSYSQKRPPRGPGDSTRGNEQVKFSDEPGGTQGVSIRFGPSHSAGKTRSDCFRVQCDALALP